MTPQKSWETSPAVWDPALACKHDYIQEVASHFPTLGDSQLGSTLVQIILQMQSSGEGQNEMEDGGRRGGGRRDWGKEEQLKGKAAQIGL